MVHEAGEGVDRFFYWRFWSGRQTAQRQRRSGRLLPTTSIFFIIK